MSRPSVPDMIAALMDRLDPYSGTGLNEEFTTAVPGGSVGAPAELPTVGSAGTSTPPAGNTSANRVITTMRECQAASCTNNVRGNLCSLKTISINKTGGCAEYVAEAADYNADTGNDEYELADADTIEGISNSMPAAADHPSSITNMNRKYQPGIGS